MLNVMLREGPTEKSTPEQIGSEGEGELSEESVFGAEGIALK